MKAKTFFLIVTLILLLNTTSSVEITLPVPHQLVLKLSLSITRLQDTLKTIGTRYENKYHIYKRVQLTKVYLLALNSALSQFNNVITGAMNKVQGNKNIILGNYNSVQGSNNWVFISGFTGNINGDLLIDDWRIQIDKAKLILINPRLAISFLEQKKNLSVKNKYLKKERQYCKWDKWINPDNPVADKHWKKYKGYNEWKGGMKDVVKTVFNWSNWGSWGSWKR